MTRDELEAEMRAAGWRQSYELVTPGPAHLWVKGRDEVLVPEDETKPDYAHMLERAVVEFARAEGPRLLAAVRAVNEQMEGR